MLSMIHFLVPTTCLSSEILKSQYSVSFLWLAALSCPEGKEYQPCVKPCEAKTCWNKWLYEDSPCSYLREDCVCKSGTVLHRTDSDLCIPEEKCSKCTRTEGVCQYLLILTTDQGKQCLNSMSDFRSVNPV